MKRQPSWSNKRKTPIKRRRFSNPRQDQQVFYRTPIYNPMSPEIKFFETGINDTAISTVWDVQANSLNLVPQGVTESTRVGNKLMLKKLFIKGYLSSDGNSGSDDMVRVVVYLDKQCNGTAAGAGDLWESNNINTFRNMANSKRFKILSDERHLIKLTAVVANVALPVIVPYEKYLDVNKYIEYDSTTGALTEIRSNNIGIMSISLSGTSNFVVTCRIKYTDQ